MNKFYYLLPVFVMVFLTGFITYANLSWEIQEGYAITFYSKKASGVFTSFSGDVRFDEHNLAASGFDVTVDVASIDTGNKLKNKHARGRKWFDAKTYPKIRFASQQIMKTDSGYVAAGILDMRGVQKEIQIPFTFRNNTFAGGFSVNRLDYNIGTNKGLSRKVSNEIKVEITVPVKPE